MKLNLYTIEHELGGIVAGASLHSDCNAPKADYPILFGVGDHRYYDNIVYVAASRHLEESKEKIKRYLSQNPGLTFSCVCIGTPPAFCLEAKNCDVVWTDGQESRSRTFNAVQRVFQHFNAWERELGAVIDRGGELADLVNASLKVFRNDLCITDPFSRVLVHRVFRHERFTREQTDLIKEGECLPQNMVFDGIEDEREGQDFASFAPTFPVMKAFDCTVLRSVVSVSRDYALILSVHPNYQPVGKKDCAPALVLADALKRLSAAFGRMEGGDHYFSVHSTLKAIVQGKQVPDSDLIQCALAQGWNRDADEYACLCIDFMPNLQIQDCCFMRPYVSVCNRLQALLDCAAFVIDSRIVAVVDCTQMPGGEDGLHAEIARFAADHRLVAGASAPYFGLRSLQSSYAQAFAALRMGYAETDRHLVRFADHALDIGMNFIMKELGPERFCPRALIELAQHDHDLYVALEAYLKANCNSSVAARRLHLQRNSFVYRLEKARKLLGMDLDDPDVRLLLLISFKLIDLYGLDNMELFALGDKR